MATAGRILIMPKGKWASNTAYEALDLVSHNGNSWLCKKTAVGIEPSDGNAAYWFKFTDNDSVDVELEGIRNSLAGKADKTALDALSESVEGKANQTDLEALAKEVSGMSNQKEFDELAKKVEGKVDRTEFDALAEDIGDDDISGIGNGTVTGAIVELDSNFKNNTLITPSVNSRFTFVSGGYVNMGKFVFVQVVVKANATASNSPSTLTIGEIKHDSALSCIDTTNQISNSITASVPCGASSGGTVYIKEVTENHIYAITGMLLR